MNDQEALVDLEDFDYDIPQLPIAEDLLKIIIKKLNKINDKIDFLTHHFIQDLGKLTQYFFMHDYFDEE